jgi:hypothetical protein
VAVVLPPPPHPLSLFVAVVAMLLQPLQLVVAVVPVVPVKAMVAMVLPPLPLSKCCCVMRPRWYYDML